MKSYRIFVKTLKEQIRSGWDLILSISLAPFIIVIYWVFLGSGAGLTLNVVVVNNDLQSGTPQACSDEVIKDLISLKNADGTYVLHIKEVDNATAAEDKIKDRQAIAAIVFPDGYSKEIQRVRENGGIMSAEVSAVIIGDQGNPYYALVSAFVVSELESYVMKATGQQMPFIFQERFVGDGTIRNEFDSYVPGLLIASITLIIFSVSIGISREIESGTMRRLKLTRITSFDFLGGVSLVYIFFGLISVDNL
ncbi:MAG: ABC transporter permease [Dehalococcoidales bacterium]|nr:ABC transporter permease [Dehalococcoidales bacterium]